MDILHTIALDMLEHAKGISLECAQAGRDFIPTFIIYKNDGGIQPVPMPHYTKDREFHRTVMRAMLDAMKADGFLFVMEAWFAAYDSETAADHDAPGFVPPSQRTDREELLMVHGMSREGGEAAYNAKINRHGHKLTFGKTENMTDSAHGKSVMAMMGPMFGEKPN